MDYSLLIGVVRRKFEVMDRTNSHPITSDTTNLDIFQRDNDGGMHAAVVEGPGTYYMGIIDVLQQWNWEKKLERFFKVYFKWMDPDGLSAVPPQQYVDRFMKRCVVEVFEGLNVSDSDFNPKMRTNYGYRNTRLTYLNENGIINVTNDNTDEFDDSIGLSADKFRMTAGIDRRFSAAPLDNDSPLSLQLSGNLGSSFGGRSTVGTNQSGSVHSNLETSILEEITET